MIKPDANVLVIIVARIGDTLLVTPALRALKAAIPHGRLTVLAHPKRLEVLQHLPFIDALEGITKTSARARGWGSASAGRRRRPGSSRGTSPPSWATPSDAKRC